MIQDLFVEGVRRKWLKQLYRNDGDENDGIAISLACFKRSHYHSERRDVCHQWAYALMSEFIRFVISSTMSKVKLWTSSMYETKA